MVAVEMEKSEWIQDNLEGVPPGLAHRLDVVYEERGIKHDFTTLT